MTAHTGRHAGFQWERHHNCKNKFRMHGGWNCNSLPEITPMLWVAVKHTVKCGYRVPDVRSMLRQWVGPRLRHDQSPRSSCYTNTWQVPAIINYYLLDNDVHYTTAPQFWGIPGELLPFLHFPCRWATVLQAPTRLHYHCRPLETNFLL